MSARLQPRPPSASRRPSRHPGFAQSGTWKSYAGAVSSTPRNRMKTWLRAVVTIENDRAAYGAALLRSLR
ncbi:hypothetical protein XM57_23035 [Burkholderia cepacia]|nr:hypothetical protein XM57_23035 [Burkholderia cepacia]ETP63660.1 hypothetical protein BDSB_16905 [Burkholderia dolosa PC543]